jgi:hypothetical protein
MRKSSFLLCVLTVAAGAAEAQTPVGFYAGGGVVTGSVNNVFSSGLDLNNTNWKLFAGLHPAQSPLGIEAEYIDFGSVTNQIAHAQGNVLAADLMLYVPLFVPPLSAYGKAGMARWQVSGSVLNGFAGFDEHATQFTWGVGAKAQFGAFAARIEYERFNILNTDGANVITIGGQFTFL